MLKLTDDQRALVNAHSAAIINRATAKYHHLSREILEDLRAALTLRLCISASRFDATTGVSFEAYASRTVAFEVRTFFREHGYAIKLHRSLRTGKVFSQPDGEYNGIDVQSLRSAAKPLSLTSIEEDTASNEDVCNTVTDALHSDWLMGILQEGLSESERLHLGYRMEGMSTQEIARFLKLSPTACEDAWDELKGKVAAKYLALGMEP